MKKSFITTGQEGIYFALDTCKMLFQLKGIGILIIFSIKLVGTH